MVDILKSVFKKTVSLLFSIIIFLSCVLPVSASVSSGIAQSEKQINQWARAQIFSASLSDICDMLLRGEITSEELCEVYIERINAYDKKGPRLNSIISLNTNAIEQAKILDNERKAGIIRGKLHGVPILVKDNIDVSGFPTTLGKKSLSEEVKENDAAAVAFLVSQGAIILGKTNLSTDDEIAKYTVSSIIGETRNVYNTAYSSGGSSGGAAVAVMASFAAASLATDTNFSLAYPAALNGAVSYRPSFNLVDYSGCENVVSARDVVAPVTKTVEDAAIMLDILTDNASSEPYSSKLDSNALNGKTIAVVKELSGYTYNSPNEFKNSDKEITALFDAAKKKLEELGAKVVTVSVPKLFTYYNTCREGNKNSENAKANLKAELLKLLEDNGADAFVFPTYLSSPLPSGFDKYGDHKSNGLSYLNCSGYLPSLVGFPAINLPMGMHSSGVSAGIEFVAPAGEDAKLLSLAYSFENNTDFKTASSIVPNLYDENAKKPEPSKTLEDENVSFVPSDIQNDQTVQNKGFVWQNIAVLIIITAVLVLCVWVLVFGMKKPDKNGENKNRHF